MKRFSLIVLLFLGIVNQILAQEKLRVTFNDGTFQDFRISDVQNIDFTESSKAINLLGEWFYCAGSGIKYIVWDFDGKGNVVESYCTYASLDEGVTYDASYTLDDNILEIKKQGTISRYLVKECTETDLIVQADIEMHFYKVIDNDYTVEVDEVIDICNPGDEIVATDGNFVKVVDGKIVGERFGTGYALVWDNALGRIVAYKIYVNPSHKVIDFSSYFGKTQEELIEMIGYPNSQKENSSYAALHYYSYFKSMEYVSFYLLKETNKVEVIDAFFETYEEFRPYLEHIYSTYYFVEKSEDGNTEIFVDAQYLSEVTTMISIDWSTGSIRWSNYSR